MIVYYAVCLPYTVKYEYKCHHIFIYNILSVTILAQALLLMARCRVYGLYAMTLKKHIYKYIYIYIYIYVCFHNLTGPKSRHG